MSTSFAPLISSIRNIPLVERRGAITAIRSNTLQISGLSGAAKLGDLVSIRREDSPEMFGEVLSLQGQAIEILPEHGCQGVSLKDAVIHVGSQRIMPDQSWLGRVLDPFLRPLDGNPLIHGMVEMPLKSNPPAAATRKRLGGRMSTGVAALDTFVPIVRGQRMGIFAGSGVGKSTLLADLAKGVDTDVVVIALIGERGREVRDFVEDVLGSEGMKRSVVVAATSDQSSMIRRRCAWVATAISEFFRDKGAHVLLLADSVTRFAEAHREIALSSGELAGPQGFPPSTSQELMALCERAGPGKSGAGDITAVFSVLVQGSDMEGPIADVMRGILDGHLVLSREIAERGRFPAIDVLKSVSRSLPSAASPEELEILTQARNLMSEYEDASIMIKAGLYEVGTDENIDRAISSRPKIEAFLSGSKPKSSTDIFTQLSNCINFNSLQKF
ncbi:FliI/YscN family ATPase [Litoreibacter arenae]|uniref:Flagellum-specific ATP synthase FliI n=1 Tax=Litoreibacter arenae DSM 19593 TaxID=1123360 RepID=S9Q7H2_9RHOB|nr:FliI/YscN family ATPase [Litoreibacter arenae]EPX77336.1 Flagellum-specific ATP synthase FliI [Litoreibacter arenae DSM 19593]